MCRVLDIQSYVLRYWQTEFPALAAKEAEGQREYDAEELGIIRRIKELLYDEGYTIASAKKKLSAELQEGSVRRLRPDAAGGERPLEAESPTKAAPDGDSETAAAEDETPRRRPADAGAGVSGAGDLGALTRRVERLEGGVATLVSQARQLAAELKRESVVEDD